MSEVQNSERAGFRPAMDKMQKGLVEKGMDPRQAEQVVRDAARRHETGEAGNRTTPTK